MTKNIWTLRGLRDLRGENVCAAFDEEQRSGNLRKPRKLSTLANGVGAKI